jgi:hypothetical protein
MLQAHNASLPLPSQIIGRGRLACTSASGAVAGPLNVGARLADHMPYTSPKMFHDQGHESDMRLQVGMNLVLPIQEYLCMLPALLLTCEQPIIVRSCSCTHA